MNGETSFAAVWRTWSIKRSFPEPSRLMCLKRRSKKSIVCGLRMNVTPIGVEINPLTEQLHQHSFVVANVCKAVTGTVRHSGHDDYLDAFFRQRSDNPVKSVY